MNPPMLPVERSPVRASVVFLRVICLAACLYLGFTALLNAWFIVGPELASGELVHRRFAVIVGAAIILAGTFAISLFRTRSLPMTALLLAVELPVMVALFFAVLAAWSPTV